MASLGHFAAGVAFAHLYEKRAERRLSHYALFTALSFLPDADVIAFAFGIPYAHDFGHRGASHSIAFAVIVGLITWALSAERRMAVFATLVTLSHPLLDALTDGGLGVALFWPLSSTRHFFFWQPIPVAPIGPGFLSRRGLFVALTELLWFLPVLLYGLWPWRPRRTAR